MFADGQTDRIAEFLNRIAALRLNLMGGRVMSALDCQSQPTGRW